MTIFQKKVYEIVRHIPRGRVTTYQAIADAIGWHGAARAVGNALNKNMSVLVPCHRVIRSDGFVGGYRDGLRKKIIMLRQEGVSFDGHRVAKACRVVTIR